MKHKPALRAAGGGSKRADFLGTTAPIGRQQASQSEHELPNAEGKRGLAHDPIAATVPIASHISGLSRSEIYRRLADGSIHAVKNGSRTLILMDSLRTHLSSLPPARFGADKAA